MSFLRKQESRLVPAQAGIQAYLRSGGNRGDMDFSYFYFLDSRLCGNDTLGLARQENGELLHSAKMLRILKVGGLALFFPEESSL